MATYHIPDMSCGHCKATIETTIQALDPAARIDFDMAARRISVESTLDAVQIQAALGQAGYPAALP
ncbi:heavy-metal-associated domain-containing protein [Rhodobacter sp. NTK016B]|jgi:copper chaperone|uniref:heavy-metal-associated domain-containing protein n=1 Tax=Rhodobacterales TaxID=204455 RepID=UPI000F8F363B|nr:MULTISPECIES: heavy-metal-associated domain-containing protein [Paracoccaceae]MBN8291859.1 heavy-metal-associated domain-containing protein [Rhodobacter sp. NTK016B]